MTSTNSRRRYSNTAAVTGLNGAIDATQTTIVVASAAGYPSAPFTIRIENEILLVTDVSGTTFTVERGFDGSTGVAHSTATEVTHVAIAADFRNRWLDVITYDDSITAYDDEFGGIGPVSWSDVTPTGNAVWSEARGSKTVLYNSQSTSDFAGHLTSLNGLSYPLYTTTAIRFTGQRLNYQMVGLAFSNGTTSASTCVIAHFQRTSGGTTPTFQRRSGTWTNLSTVQTGYTHNTQAPWLHLRLDWVSTDSYRAWMSVDGWTWNDFGAGNFTAGVTPTHYGLAVSTWNGTAAGKMMATFDFFRTYDVKPTYWQET